MLMGINMAYGQMEYIYIYIHNMYIYIYIIYIYIIYIYIYLFMYVCMDICFSIFLRCEEPYPFFWRIWGGTSTESHVKRKHDDLSWFLSFVNGFRGNPFSNASRRWWKLVGIVEQFYGTIMETITGEDANGEWTWWARFLAEQPSQKPHFPMKNTISLIFWDHMAGGCLAHLKITLIPLRST
jgi:hypothetical protein